MRQLSKLPTIVPDIPGLCVSHRIRRRPFVETLGTEAAGGGADSVGVVTGVEKGRLSHDKGPPEKDLKCNGSLPSHRDHRLDVKGCSF